MSVSQREKTYLVALEGTDALAALDAGVGVHASRNSKLPEFDCLVQTTADQVAAVGCKGNRVHAVLVAIGVLQTLHQVASRGVPHAHALVQRASRNIVAIGGHGHRRHTVLDAEGVDEFAIKYVPETHGLVTTAGGNVTAIAGKVQ